MLDVGLYLVEVDEDVVEGLLGVLGAAAAEGLDGLDGLLGAVELLHHHRHVLERAVHPIPGVYGLPEQHYRRLRILLH